MDHNENVQNRVQIMCSPKGIEYVSAWVMQSKDVYHKYETQQEHTSDTSGCFE